MSNFSKWIITIAVGAIVILLVIIFTFCFPKISTVAELILQVINIIAIVIIANMTIGINKSSIKLAELSVQTEKNALKFEQDITGLKLRPLISLNLTRSNVWKCDAYSWYLMNCSEYAALNVFVRFSKGDGIMSNWVACNSILKNDIELFWVYGAATIETCYCNVKMNEYFKTKTISCINKFENITKSEYEDIVDSVMKKNNNIADIATTKIRIEDSYRTACKIQQDFDGDDVRKILQIFNKKIEELLFDKKQK